MQIQQHGNYFKICDNQQNFIMFSLRVLELTEIEEKGKQGFLSFQSLFHFNFCTGTELFL